MLEFPPNNTDLTSFKIHWRRDRDLLLQTLYIALYSFQSKLNFYKAWFNMNVGLSEYVFIFLPHSTQTGYIHIFASLVSCPGCVRGPLITRLGSPVTSQISVHSDGVYTYILRDHSEKSAGTGSGNKKQLTLARRIQFTQLLLN